MIPLFLICRTNFRPFADPQLAGYRALCRTFVPPTLCRIGQGAGISFQLQNPQRAGDAFTMLSHAIVHFGGKRCQSSKNILSFPAQSIIDPTSLYLNCQIFPFTQESGIPPHGLVGDGGGGRGGAGGAVDHSSVVPVAFRLSAVEYLTEYKTDTYVIKFDLNEQFRIVLESRNSQTSS